MKRTPAKPRDMLFVRIEPRIKQRLVRDAAAARVSLTHHIGEILRQHLGKRVKEAA